MPTGFHSFSKKFESWILSLLDPYFLSHTWSNFGNGEEQALVHEMVLKFACDTLELPSCIEFCQKQFFRWMDSPGEKNPLHPRGRDIVLSVALKTISTRIDESRKFIEDHYQKANATRNKLMGSHATFSFLDLLRRDISGNIDRQNDSSSQESAGLGDSFHSLEYYKYVDVSAEQALNILEMGLDQIHNEYRGKEVKEYIKHLLKPLVSEASLKRLEKLRNKLRSRLLDSSNK